MSGSWQRTVFMALSAVLIAVVVSFAFLLNQTYQEYRAYREREAAYAHRVEQVEAAIEEKQAYLDRLENDPEFLERVVRERLGYSQPDELLYRFEE